MTDTSTKSGELVLLLWANIDSKDLPSAFRKKSQWVIGAPQSLPVWYSAVLSNLICRYIHSERESIEIVRDTLHSGLTRSAFDRLKYVTGATTEALGRAINIPPRTLSRRNVFKQDESERLLRVASAFQRTLEVFGDVGKARKWFTSPKRMLGERTPLEFCDSGPGAEEVEHLLGRIEHGVFT